MAHPLVAQLRFTRSEFLRGLEGLSEEDARRRILPLNCISWNIGHMAWHEQRYWLLRGQGILLLPQVNELFASGAAASTPALAEIRAAWEEITRASDPWLDDVTADILQEQAAVEGRPGPIFGNLLQRVIYHYWYHTGENAAIRQALGHNNLPQFVGNLDEAAPFRPA
jgi:hypothetical protein